MQEKHFQDWISLIVGVWLIISPFVLQITPPVGGTADLPLLNFVLSGAAAVVLAVAALFFFREWEEWLEVALGIWIIASPWALGFTNIQVAMWNAIACGVVIAAMGMWAAIDVRREKAH